MLPCVQMCVCGWLAVGVFTLSMLHSRRSGGLVVYMGRDKNGQTKRGVRGRDLRESFG